MITVIRLLLIGLSLVSMAAAGPADSLRSVIRESAADTIRADAHLKLARLLKDSEPGEALDHARIAGQLYAQAAMPEKQAGALLQTAIIRVRQGLPDSVQTIIDQVGAIYDHCGRPDLYGDALLRLTEAAYDANQYDYAVSLASNSHAVFDRSGDFRRSAQAIYLLGRSYWHLGDFQRSLTHFQESLQYYLQTNDSSMIAKMYNGLGSVHWFISNYDEAFNYFMRSLEIREKLGLTDRIIISLNNIGLVLNDWGRSDNALEYLRRALDMAVAINDSNGIAYSQLNLGIAYIRLKDGHQAMRYLDQAARYYQRSGQPDDIANYDLQHGDAYDLLGQPLKAIEAYRKALDQARKVNSRFRMAMALHHLARMTLKTGPIATAVRFLDQSMDIAAAAHYKQIMALNYTLRARIAEQTGAYQEALAHLKRHEAYQDSIFDEIKLASFNDLQTRLALETREKENLALRRNSELQQLALRNERLLRHFLVTFLVSVLIILSLSIYRWRESIRTNRLLHQQNDAIRVINAEKEHLIAELTTTLENVKQLQKLLPICASCKRIRDDDGYWQNIEAYFMEHSEISFTHGLCPECMRKLYPEYMAARTEKG